MKKLLSSSLSPFSPWLAFQTVLVLHQSFMLVCLPSQPCRWCPVQPVGLKSSLSLCVLVCILWVHRFVVRTSPKGSDPFTEVRCFYRGWKIGYKWDIIINFSVFAVSCFDRQRESHTHTTEWIHILPPENPQNLYLSFCQQTHPNFDWVRHNVPSISSTELWYRLLQEVFFVVRKKKIKKRCCVIFLS